MLHMPAAYDNFDYPNYWSGRQYEHNSEVIALRSFLEKIPEIHRTLDVGAGYGRLTSEYLYRANQVYLVDSSSSLLKIARKNYSDEKKIKFIHSRLENVGNKIGYRSMDLLIMVRILHHINNLEEFISSADKYIKKEGYLILEFPNKNNFKNLVKEILSGNFTYPLEIFPKERNMDNKQSIPFKNYHPDTIKTVLLKHNYKIIEKRSVSNIRNSFLKNHLPQDFILLIEGSVQKLLSTINFGPSIFILAQKT